MTTTITLREPADFVDLAPVVLGFAPSESLVLMTLGSFHARVDLPTDARSSVDMARALLAPLVQHDVEQFAVVCFGDFERAEMAYITLTMALRQVGKAPITFLHVYDGDDWCTDMDSREIHPLRHRVTADAVLAGHKVTGSRDDIVATAATIVDADTALESAQAAYDRGDGASAWIYLDRYDEIGPNERSHQADVLEHRLRNAIDPKEA